MVKICSDTYSKDNEYFEKFSFPLSSFQKYAIEAITTGNHVLVTAHTGSGKTLPAEFAIEYFVSQRKKVIYTSPIKALSNQKFYEFTKKFPNISFGILTGDIKFNPEADVLIMTTEILQNTLYKKINKSNNDSSLLMFDMDIDNELACVIFDEVHYINDPERGKVWEETIMMLPPQIQMVMLSATLDSPATFAQWCETKGQAVNNSGKIVYLTTTYERVVPLTHYSFITTNKGIFKAIKDKAVHQEINNIINKPFILQGPKGEFNEVHYHKMTKMLKLFQDNNVTIKRQHIINEVCNYMKENNMLPALCFVLSRKQLEICAKEVTVPLLEDDSKVGYTVRYECEQIMRKLPNYQEYLELPEYLNMVSLLEKGIAIHHAGVMPVLREMVELLYAKGYIKLLFATETFAVGINMPTKSVIFTDCNKFDGNHMRMLYSHEYTQMAGRAGRRGIDTIGSVIHLNNLFKNVELTGYRNMLKGTPQKLSSKFKISYNLLLNLLDIGETDFVKFAKKSMIQEDITKQLGTFFQNISKLESELQKHEGYNTRTPIHIIEEYIDLQENLKFSNNKKRKDMERRIATIKDTNKWIESDKLSIINNKNKQIQLTNLEKEYQNINLYLDNNVDVILNFLEKENMISEDHINLTQKGKIGTNLREVNCLVFSELIINNVLDNFSAKELVGLFSCFTNINVVDDIKNITCKNNNKLLETTINNIKEKYDSYLDFEIENKINTGTDYNIHYDLINHSMNWCDAVDADGCKFILQSLEKEKGIFLGEFVKALLKINNISSEIEIVAEYIGNISLLSKLKEIANMTLKYVVTNQSLYV
uniref:Helicase ATP-binding domain-containing protein n=1 Tax=viral metagenome TaxID=1070528 RepID=A0A6C0DAK9_9ZZZZ